MTTPAHIKAFVELDQAESYRDGYAVKAIYCLNKRDYEGFASYAEKARQMEVQRRVIEQRIILGVP